VIENLELFCRSFEVEVDLKDRLPRYTDDLYTLVGRTFMAGKERVKSNAAIAIRAVRRERFRSVGEYIEEWRKAIQELQAQRIPIDPYVATKLMLLDLRDEMPMTINMLEGKVDRRALLPMGVSMKFCDEIIAKSTKTLDENMPT
jgi:ApbE superfamily uncharacterized protein (UPF0280 family)